MKKRKIIVLLIILLIMIALIVATVIIVFKSEDSETDETFSNLQDDVIAIEDGAEKQEEKELENQVNASNSATSDEEDVFKIQKSTKGGNSSGKSSGSTSSTQSSSTKKKKKTTTEVELTQKIYNMKTVIGRIYIPKTGISLKVYSESNIRKLETMACFIYTTGGLNKKGVTLIAGHNKRNGRLFSNNKRLNKGDVFYFTDYTGKKLKYTIYSKTIKKSDDMSFLKSNIDAPVIALSCCTDANNDNRLIILGKAK